MGLRSVLGDIRSISGGPSGLQESTNRSHGHFGRAQQASMGHQRVSEAFQGVSRRFHGELRASGGVPEASVASHGVSVTGLRGFKGVSGTALKLLGSL